MASPVTVAHLEPREPPDFLEAAEAGLMGDPSYPRDPKISQPLSFDELKPETIWVCAKIR